jgi:hypothetical protein
MDSVSNKAWLLCFRSLATVCVSFLFWPLSEELHTLFLRFLTH